jgi:hypothetical protein
MLPSGTSHMPMPSVYRDGPFGLAARASRAFDPPTSSSLAEESTPLLPPCPVLAPLAEAGALCAAAFLTRSSRTAARQLGSARRARDSRRSQHLGQIL